MAITAPMLSAWVIDLTRMKEPYLTSMSDTEYVVRVDHVSDIMFIPFFDEMVPFPRLRYSLPMLSQSLAIH
jgi:hypothetical protein